MSDSRPKVIEWRASLTSVPLPTSDDVPSGSDSQLPQQRQRMGQQERLEQLVAPKKAGELGASRRPHMTTEQSKILEGSFQRNAKPVTEVKKQLAQQTGLSLHKITVNSHFCHIADVYISNYHGRTGSKTDGQRLKLTLLTNTTSL